MAKPFRQNIYQFDEFRLDAGHLMLSRDNREIQLAPKAIETLLALVERRGEIVSKDELLEAIWPDTTVEESNLFLYLSILRKTLGTRASGEPYLETLRRRGYRFTGDVFLVDTADEEELRLFVEDNGLSGDALIQAEPGLVRKERRREDWLPRIDRLTVAPSPSSTARPFEEPHYGGSAPVTGVSQSTAASPRRESSEESSREGFWVAFLLGAILVTVVATATFYWRGERTVTNQGKQRTLAVLPFRPLIDGQNDDQLELGMADTLITRLGSNGSINVRSIASVLKYKNTDLDPVKVGKDLGVEAIVTGSLQHSGDLIRVNVRLLRVADGSVLWSDTFDEKFTEIFDVQDTIASMIAGALDSHLAGEKRYTSSTQAYEYFIRGRYHQYRITEEGFKKSIEFYEQAVASDPNYALAYANMSSTYRAAASAGFARAKEVLPKAKIFAEKALELDPLLAEPYAVLGWYYFIYEWDWALSEAKFKQAVDLSPTNSDVRIGYALLLSFTKRHEEAVDQARRARELNPTTLIVLALESQILLNAGYEEEAMNRAKKALDFDQNFWPGRVHLAEAYRVQRRYVEAAAEYERAKATAPEGFGPLMWISRLYCDSGDRERLYAILNELEYRTKEKYVPFHALARIYNGLGRYDEALDLLERSLEAREAHLVGILIDRQFDNLRTEPRFIEILRKMNWNK